MSGVIAAPLASIIESVSNQPDQPTSFITGRFTVGEDMLTIINPEHLVSHVRNRVPAEAIMA